MDSQYPIMQGPFAGGLSSVKLSEPGIFCVLRFRIIGRQQGASSECQTGRYLNSSEKIYYLSKEHNGWSMSTFRLKMQ